MTILPARIVFNSLLVCAAIIAANPAKAAFMNMAMDNGQAAYNIAANAAMNSALCNSTNTCNSSRSAQEKTQKKAESDAVLACKREVIYSTQSGTSQRKAGYARCEAMRSSGPSQISMSNTNAVATNNVNLNYRVSAPVTKKVKNDVVRATRHLKGGNPAKLQSMIYDNDIEVLYGDLMSPQGLRAGNLTDATTGYWLTMWSIVNQAPMPGRAEALAVRKQMQSALSSTVASKASDAEKQHMAQMMMWNVMLSLAAYRRPDMDRPELARVTNENAKRQGFDLSKIKITRTGFVQ